MTEQNMARLDSMVGTDVTVVYYYGMIKGVLSYYNHVYRVILTDTADDSEVSRVSFMLKNVDYIPQTGIIVLRHSD